MDTLHVCELNSRASEENIDVDVGGSEAFEMRIGRYSDRHRVQRCSTRLGSARLGVPFLRVLASNSEGATESHDVGQVAKRKKYGSRKGSAR